MTILAGMQRLGALVVLGRDIVDARPNLLDDNPRKPTSADVRIQTHLDEQAAKTRRAFCLFLVFLLVLGVAVVWMLASDVSAVSQVAAALTVAVTGSVFGTWWSRRSASRAHLERIATFGDIFLESPATLKAVLNPAKVDEFVKNLLSVILGDQALGVSVWTDVVGKMVDDIADDRFRGEMSYDIALRDLDTDLTIPGTDVIFAARSYRLIETRLSYVRRVSALGDAVDVGLILDSAEGLNWFRQLRFFEREYLDIDSDLKHQLRQVARTVPKNGIGGLVDRASAFRRSTGGQSQRTTAATALASPTITIGSHELELTRTESHAEGIALHFPIPRPVLRELKGELAVRITAAMAIPILKTRDTFSFVLPELTRGLSVGFDCAHSAGVHDLQGEILVSGGEPFADLDTAALPLGLTFASPPKGWVLPGSGIIFRWRNE